MMQRQDLPETIYPQITNQNNVVLRMERLVKTQLELSILELKRELDLEEFDLVPLGQSVIDDFSPLMSDRSLSPDSDYSEEPVNLGGQRKNSQAANQHSRQCDQIQHRTRHNQP